MKRCVSLLLSIVLLLAGIGFAEEEDPWVEFDADVVGALERSAKEWMSTSADRAMLTVLMALELLEDEQNEYLPPDLGKTSYVGRDGLNLTVIMYEQVDESAAVDDEGRVYIIVYNPRAGFAEYMMQEDMSDLILTVLLDEVCGDDWYENDLEDILEVATALQDILEDD